MQTRGEVYAIPNSKSNLLRESVVSLTYFQLCVVCIQLVLVQYLDDENRCSLGVPNLLVSH
mgnify:CR=1 FL=1